MTVLRRVGAAVAVGLVAAVVIQIPVVGLLLMLFAVPLLFFFPELGETGAYVGVGFLWITLKTPSAWIAYAAYFGVLYFFCAELLRWLMRKRKKS